MDKKELRDYVKVLCDAENALYACDEAIREMGEKCDGLRYPPKPQKPERGIAYDGGSSILDYLVGCVKVVGVLGGIAGIVYIIYDIATKGTRMGVIGSILSVPLALLVWGALGVIAGGILGLIISPLAVIIGTRNDKKYLRKKQSDMDATYDIAYNDYESALDLNRSQTASIDKARRILNDQIKEQQTVRRRIVMKLQALYSEDIIHPNYRNIVAINQINDYLQTGICDTLEGTNGAYALYMQDVRAERICSSIRDLKLSLENSMDRMAGMMASLSREMRENNIRIAQIGSTISGGFSQIESSMREANINQARSREELNRANRHLEEMERTLKTSAHNEYIAIRESNLDKYNKTRKP